MDYICNKCGYVGPESDHSKFPRSGAAACGYLAAPIKSVEINIPDGVLLKAADCLEDRPLESNGLKEYARNIVRWFREEARQEALAEARDCGCGHKIAERISKLCR